MANSAVRKSSARHGELLDAMLEGLNVARDSKALVVVRNGTIIEINRLASQLCGRPQQELVGKSAATELFDDTPTRHRDPTIERWETALKTASGMSVPVEVVRHPLGARLQGIIVFAFRDLRERREAIEERDRQSRKLQQREEELRTQNMRFDMAINNMSQGLAMFDAGQRLLVCNRLYADLYGLTPEQVKPGTTLRQLLEYRHAKGVFGNIDFESFVHDWLAEFSKASSRIQQLADGRIISIVRRPMPDGGLVSTTEDITERQELSARLEQQNLRFNLALKNMSQGLCMFDSDERLVVANDRYAELYGLTPEQVTPGTPFREIVEARIALGAYAGDNPESYIRERLAAVRERHASTKIQTLSDGRTLAVVHQPMADGGWLATHEDITEQRRYEARIAHMAHHDALTDLANRSLLNERLEHALAGAKRGDIVAIHLLDLDLFKNVNDTLGHAAGDKLLKAVSGRLRAVVRETDTVARMGGDEFAIVQRSIEHPLEAAALADRAINAVSEPYDIGGQSVVVGTSVGIAIGPADGTDPDKLIRNADLALYRAKSAGRGAFTFFEPGMDVQMQARRALESDMRAALPAGQFELHYQPVLNLARNEIVGVEALIRWRHPERGMVAPGEFIPLAEETGFIVPLGEWVIRQACAAAANWPDNVKVAANLSPAQFRSPALVQVVMSALASSGLASNRLELEITETVLLQDTTATLATLHRLRDLGVHIVMDDFGTGYSSLSYLRSFPFDKIKIDRSFVKDITASTGSLQIVRAVSAMAKGLGMQSTAEGVETQEQLDTVTSEGCTEMQGFLFSKPLPAHQVDHLIRGRDKGRMPVTATDAA
jgi:diguanylate cyclase (GGDEF)-like protein/PAS domain S-box-containing protein